MNKIERIITIILLILMLSSLFFINNVQAMHQGETNIYSAGDCGSLLMYKGIVVKTFYAEYINNGVKYPAYCLDKTKQGVTNEINYSVNVQEKVNDVGLWRRIVNGYPYVSYQELGCANKEEAFTATKQAIYCYIHGNKVEDYKPIGEAGQRTLNALKMIVDNANNSNATSPSNMLNIKRETNKWQLDKKDNRYVYKIYSVQSEGGKQSYSVELKTKNEDIIVTDIENKEKNQFNKNEQFKILVPIKSMTNDEEFIINIKANIDTKPILYGRSSNDIYQDYALTMASFEEGAGETKESYSINETKIQIIKKDEETGKPMEGVEFSILDENKKILYKNLKTDKEGKIILNNLLPGVYYIQEQNTLEGYQKYEELIEIDIDWMEEFTVVVNNKKNEEPEIEKKENHTSVTTEYKTSNHEVLEYNKKEVKVLPKTGM